MSVKVMTHVWEHSKAKGSGLLLLLSIADHAHDDGQGAYPSVARLAERTRLDQRSVLRLIKALVTLGELEVQYQKGPHRVNLYAIPLGDNLSPSTVTPMTGMNLTPVTGGTIRGTVSEPLGEQSSRKARPSDPLWDALVDAMHCQPTTKGERGKWNAARKQLSDAGATPAQVRARAGAWRVKYPNAHLTPFALVNHWSSLGPPLVEQVTRGIGPTQEEPPADFKMNTANLRAMREQMHL